MKIIAAIPMDSVALTNLTIRSKSHWNYSKEQIEAWLEDLTITTSYIEEKQIFKLVNETVLIGYYSYFKRNEGDIKLDYLFIDPIYIGQGYGKYLITDFLKRIKATGYKKVQVDADPNVEKFYSIYGFRTVGYLKSSIKDRFLPIMELEI